MEIEEVQPVHEAAWIVEQHPAHCVSHTGCVCLCLFLCLYYLDFLSISLCVHKVIQGGEGYLEVIDD